MSFRNFGPAARNDPAYIMQLASALSDLQKYQRATLTPISANYLANTPNEVILANAASGAITVTLPPVKQFYGNTVFIKKTDASANPVTIVPQAGNTIDDATSKAISTQYMSYTLMSTGVAWVIV